MNSRSAKSSYRVFWLGVSLALAGGCIGCSRSDNPSSTAPPSKESVTAVDKESDIPQDVSHEGESTAEANSSQSIRFEHVADCGVDFLYYGNPSPELYMTEQNGGGVAIFDFDRDGSPDLFFSNGNHHDRPSNEPGAQHHLYHSKSLPQKKLRFQSVGPLAGVSEHAFGMGAVAGDIDNDGFPDLFLCCYGKVQLWHNNGDGTFLDVTAERGLDSQLWSTSAAFADLDDDGDLDLYVTNYVDYAFSDPPCFLETTTRIPISCSPIERTAQPDFLWENLGDGTFVDASVKSGIHDVPAGKGLAVEVVDLNGDGRLDIYVANDTTENFLFQNDGAMRFRNVANQEGVSVGLKGTPESSMGIACADFDHNGRFDLFVTNFENAINDFYLNVSEAGYLHSSGSFGLDIPSRPMLAFGTVAADFDLDSWPDLFVANGHIWDLSVAEDKHEYQMNPQLFQNVNGERFRDASAACGDYFKHKWIGRSAATGDLDNDGDADLVISHQLSPAAVLSNVSHAKGNSVRVHLIGRSHAREPLGIRVKATIGKETLEYHIAAGGSFQSSSAPGILIATGDGKKPLSLEVVWSSQHVERWENLSTSGSFVLRESQTLPILLP